MKLMRCKKGHFYDAEKFDTCPHCIDDTEQVSSNGEGDRQLMNVTLPAELSLFQIQNMLGESRTSKVFRLTSNVNYALKVVDITEQASENAVDNEYRIARLLDDEKYFVAYYAMYKQGDKVYIVQPELRNLLNYIGEGYSYLERILKILRILEDVAEAIEVMHQKGIIHLDVKPTNIFVDKDNHGKLGDFSTSCEIDVFKEKPFRGGTPKFFPPEVYKAAGYSGKEDMYSFGITMYYILSGGKYPYDFGESVTRTAESEYIANENIPNELQIIIKKATAYDPNDRYDSMQEICEALRLAAHTSESYKSFKTSDYYEADVAYSCILPSIEENLSVPLGYISNTAASTPTSDNYGSSSQSRRWALAEALRRDDSVVVKEDGSVNTGQRASVAESESGYIIPRPQMARGQNAGIPVPPGKLAPSPHFCRVCGATCAPDSRFCINCGNRLDGVSTRQEVTNRLEMQLSDDDRGHVYASYASFAGETSILQNQAQLEISKVHFSAIAPKTLIKGDYTMIGIVMYEDAFRSVVDDLIKEAETLVQETKSGVVKVKEGARVKIILSSSDITVEDNIEEQEWAGEYLTFNFAVMLPKKYAKRQVLFTATVYIDDVIATRLKFIAKCWSLRQQKIKVTQENVLSAFVSYASQDRNRVAMIIQGMQKARPDMDIFFDVESLRSGESWEDALWSEIDQRDTLFLCWSHNAAESPWVAREWKYCYEHKGEEAIEPIPLEPPSSCPPPEELKRKHFNDRLLYVINAESEKQSNNPEAERQEDTWNSFKLD